MRIYKKITVVVNAMVEEDFDPHKLYVCDDVSDTIQQGNDKHGVLSDNTERFEVVDYVSAESEDIYDCETCKHCGKMSCPNSADEDVADKSKCYESEG
jgi:hypothetical protein